MMSLSEEEQKELERVNTLRAIELADKQVNGYSLSNTIYML